MITFKNQYTCNESILVPSDDENCKDKYVSLSEIFNENWYFEKDTFQVGGGVSFDLYAVSKSWRHVNSDGWEKYVNRYVMDVCVVFSTQDELYLSVSDLYRELNSVRPLSYTQIESILSVMEAYLSIREETEIMIDCY